MTASAQLKLDRKEEAAYVLHGPVEHSRWEVGAVVPTADNLLALGTLYGVSVEELMISAYFSPFLNQHFFEFAHDAYKDQQKGHKN